MPKMKVPSEGSSSSNSKKTRKNGLNSPQKRFQEVFGDSGDDVRRKKAEFVALYCLSAVFAGEGGVQRIFFAGDMGRISGFGQGPVESFSRKGRCPA